MRLNCRIASVGEVVFALLRGEGIKERAYPPPGCLLCSLCSLPQQVFEFCEHLLSWVQVWAVRGQEQKPCPLGANGGSDGGLLWLERLSSTTMSAALSVGQSSCSTLAVKLAALIG